MDKMSAFFREVLSWIMYLAIWMVVLFGVYRWVAQPFSVDGSSMEHTLEDSQRVWMWKLSEPDRFDVVIFPQPNAEVVEKAKLYVKRVIGMPGDTIAYKDDQLIINGSEMEEPYLEEKAEEYKYGSEDHFTSDFDLEMITGQAKVPEGKLFVMGDNRRNSVDGRSFGFIEADSVLGEADFIYWPLPDFGLIPQYQLNEDQTAIITK